jgi:MarR family transcriptional regulator, 2-MHQ and catechol-resistance regulon repressor
MVRSLGDPGKEPFLKILRPLVETYFAFFSKADRHIRMLGLTPSQFDVIVTLGDTEGMACKELSEKTLVTKGTLTGVLDRLSAKGLIERIPSREDRRAIFIRLTPKGEAEYKKVFPDQVYYMKPYFERALSGTQMKALRAMLLQLKESFEQPLTGEEK